MKNLNSKITAIVIVIAVAALLVGGVVAVTIWSGTANWTLTTKSFTVWNSPTDGSQLMTPYTVSPMPTTPGTYTYSYYLQNDGNAAITVTVTGAPPTGTGNTATWSNAGTYVLPVSSTRTEAQLTLVIATSGTYTWTFTGT